MPRHSGRGKNNRPDRHPPRGGMERRRWPFPAPCRRSSPGSAALAAPNTPWPNGLTPSIAGKKSRPAATEPGYRPGFPQSPRCPGATLPKLRKSPIPTGESNKTFTAPPRNLPCLFGFCSFGGHPSSRSPLLGVSAQPPAAMSPANGTATPPMAPPSSVWIRSNSGSRAFPFSRNRNRANQEVQPELTNS